VLGNFLAMLNVFKEIGVAMKDYGRVNLQLARVEQSTVREARNVRATLPLEPKISKPLSKHICVRLGLEQRVPSLSLLRNLRLL
jgi:hypothetical protein